MQKDFQQWHQRKTQIHAKNDIPFFYEREIWWCALGANIGFEQDGKGEQFSRPVLVLKKFNEYIFLALPLSTTKKTGKFYFKISSSVGGKASTAILSQLRLVDSKRLLDKIGSLPQEDFSAIKKAVGKFFTEPLS